MASCSLHLCLAVIGLCILQVPFTQAQEKYIPLATDKEPRSLEDGDGTKISQNQLFELWTNENELTKNKSFVLGSNSKVNFI